MKHIFLTLFLTLGFLAFCGVVVETLKINIGYVLAPTLGLLLIISAIIQKKVK